MGAIWSMRSPRRCSVFVLCLVLLLAVPVSAQTTVATYDKATIGGDTLPADVLRILGIGNVGSGSGTINPLAIDNLGDVRKDTTTTVSTAGAHTWSAAGSFTSTLGVTGVLSGNTGTLLLGSPTRISGTTPIFLLHESDAGSDEKYWRMQADADTLTLEAVDDALSSSTDVFNLTRTGMTLGDLRLGQNLGVVRPENNGGSSLGTLTKKMLTLHAWELWVDTLVAKRTIATIGGRIFVAPTTKLKLDLASGDACMSVEDNDLRASDTVLLQKNGKFEKILLGANAIDCSVSGNCAQTFAGYNYCSLTRNRDGTGANDWAAGDAVLNEGNVGDGYIDLYSDRSATSEGYPGHIVSDGPVAYWRMETATATTSIDVMGNVGVMTETGTQSTGLGVNGGANLGTLGLDPAWRNDGATGYLLAANSASLQITADLTIEFIAYWDATSPSTQHIVSKHHTGEYHLQVLSTGALEFCHGNGTTFACVTTSAGAMPTGSWNHYAVVRDATSSPKRVLFYRDGTLIHSGTYTQAVATSTTGVGVGASPLNLGSYFDGYVDEVAIYNYQVSADRLALHSAARANNSISKFTVGPTLCGNVRTGTGAFDLAERWCLGNLAGTYGYASSPAAVYGFASGNPSATWISADATNGFRIMNGSTEKMKADTSGNLSLTGNLTIGSSGSIIGGNFTLNTSGLEVPVTNTSSLSAPFAYKWSGLSLGGSMYYQGWESGGARGFYHENNTTSGNAIISWSASYQFPTLSQYARLALIATPTTTEVNIDAQDFRWISPRTTTGSASPVVMDPSGYFQQKTDGWGGTCFSPTLIVVEAGIITSCS
jgi:hypothetical protein